MLCGTHQSYQAEPAASLWRRSDHIKSKLYSVALRPLENNRSVHTDTTLFEFTLILSFSNTLLYTISLRLVSDMLRVQPEKKININSHFAYFLRYNVIVGVNK